MLLLAIEIQKCPLKMTLKQKNVLKIAEKKNFHSIISNQDSRVNITIEYLRKIIFTIHNFNYSLKLVQSSIKVNLFKLKLMNNQRKVY